MSRKRTFNYADIFFAASSELECRIFGIISSVNAVHGAALES